MVNRTTIVPREVGIFALVMVLQLGLECATKENTPLAWVTHHQPNSLTLNRCVERLRWANGREVLVVARSLAVAPILTREVDIEDLHDPFDVSETIPGLRPSCSRGVSALARVSGIVRFRDSPSGDRKGAQRRHLFLP